MPLSSTANGASVTPWISPDGRFVVFSSSASDLVTNDNGYLGLDVFLRDRASNTTTLVSANLSGTGGGNGQSYSGMASADGRYVVFESVASDLVPGDTNDSSDIFVRDIEMGTTTLVSVSTNGVPANRASSDAMITPDGRYVAFISAAGDLVEDDTNGFADVFVRDLVTGTTVLASPGIRNAFTPPSSPAITPDGHYVVFSSNARGLIPEVSTNTLGEVYLRDLVAGQTLWVSSNVEAMVTDFMGTTGRVASLQPAINGDGRYVAFAASGTTNTRNPLLTVLIRSDLLTGDAVVISTNAVIASTLAPTFSSEYGRSDDLYGPEMSPDARFITYTATQGDTNTVIIQQWDANTGSNLLVSADVSGNVPTNSVSHSAKASPDGRFVTFLSNATNLVTNIVSSGFHVYLRDIEAGVTKLVDANTNGVGAMDDWGTVPFLSSNGQFVAFCSADGSLVGGDNNDTYDVFLRDNVSETTELISQASPLTDARSGNTLSSSDPVSISANGRLVAFASYASDLVTGDLNNEPDIFVHDLLNGSNILVSVGMDGNAALGGNSMTPAMSADGRYVAFASLATNLVAIDTNGAADIFLRDLQTRTTTLESVNSSGGSLGTGDASAPAISADGRYVAFLCYPTAGSPSPAVYWRDLLTGTTRSLAPSGGAAVTISADGQRVAVLQQNSMFVWDAQLSAKIFNSPFGISSAAISPGGTRVAFQDMSKQLYVRDLTATTNRLIASVSPRIYSAAQWSGDARYFAFVSGSNLATADNNGTNDVYLYDFQTGAMTLVSADWSETASANGPSDSPMMSGNGRFVVFRSWASDIVVGATNAPALYAFDCLNGATTLLAASMPGSGWSSRLLHPAISSNATSVAFLSWDSHQVMGDLNGVSDVFSQTLPAPAADTDSDGDGIPNWWMVQYFGHPTAQAQDQSLAQDDADEDGTTNLQEYLAGTSPKDPNSVLRITISVSGVSNTNVLTWPAAFGRTYRVQYKNDFNDPSWLNISGVISVVGNKASFAAPASVAQRFYRVELIY